MVCFIANKRLTAIRQDGRQDCRRLFSRSFGLESRSIFLDALIAEFTLWLIAKALLIAGLRQLNLLVFKDAFLPPGGLDLGPKASCEARLYRFLFATARLLTQGQFFQ